MQSYLRGIVAQSKVILNPYPRSPNDNCFFEISNVQQIRQDLLEELRREVKDEEIPIVDNNVHSDQHLNELHNQVFDYIEGATMGDMLDFLSKELIRLQCEQTIHLFACLADRQRCQREATETGNRTKTNERQKIIDQAFQQVESIRRLIFSFFTIRRCFLMNR